LKDEKANLLSRCFLPVKKQNWDSAELKINDRNEESPAANNQH